MGEFIKLIRPKGVVDAPTSEEQKNTFICEGGPVAAGSAERWPDLVYLEVYPEMRFKTTCGQVVNTANVLSEFYHIQPVVELRDIVKVGGIYYPRLVVIECVLHSHKSGVLMRRVPDESDDLEEGEDPNIMLPCVSTRMSCGVQSLDLRLFLRVFITVRPVHNTHVLGVLTLCSTNEVNMWYSSLAISCHGVSVLCRENIPTRILLLLLLLSSNQVFHSTSCDVTYCSMCPRR